MAPPGEWQEGIVNLWPTTFIQRRLAGHQDPDRERNKLTGELERANQNLTTGYREPDLFNMAHAAVNWLRAHIQ